MTEALRHTIKSFVLPFLYFASVALVVVGGITMARFFDDGSGMSSGFVRVLTLVVFAGLVFVVSSRVLAWSDGAWVPALSDHLRHCAFLYVFVAILGAMFAAEYVGNLVAERPMYEVPRAMIVWLAAGYAIAANGLLLLWRRRFGGAEAGGAL